MTELKKCKFCPLQFTKQHALVNHMHYTHDFQNILKCEACSETFTAKKKLLNHVRERKCSASPYAAATLVCPVCRVCLSKKPLMKHFHEAHNIAVEHETLLFPSADEFYKWKKEMEKRTISSFVNRKGERKIKCGTIKLYVCHRDGKFVSRGANKRRLKTIGSNKIGGHCPALLTVKTSADSVLVNFCKTHVGHTMDLGRIMISAEDKKVIAQKIAAKVPLEEILDEIRDSLDGENIERKHLLTRKDLHNIAKTYNLNKEAVLHQNDCVSVDAWVKEMLATGNSLVRLYKPQGETLEEYPQLENNDFFLALASDAQLSILATYGNDSVCVDGTHGLNSYDFELFTIMILDDSDQGFPCAFLFSNRGDSVAMEIFFSVIKCALPAPVEPAVFMSDIADSYYSAWCSVMPHENTSRLYNVWHVDRAWRGNLYKINGKEKQAEVYRKLRVIMQETDIDTFESMMVNLMQELYSSSDTIVFAQYVDEYFANPSPWAHCFRKFIPINTSTALENMHEIVKHLYLRGRKARNLDDAFHAVMRFLKDRLYDRLITPHKNKDTHKLSDIRSRHKSSLEMSTTDMFEMDGVWSIPSPKNPSVKYEVRENDTSCSCNLRCDDCSACIHFYKCTCCDFVVKRNMCKHTHLVAQIVKQLGGRTWFSFQTIAEDDYFYEEIVAPSEEQEEPDQIMMR
ncbi:hypothetical protein PR048_028617 [Dryococelus australis]|uniref:SWIM-type domain-containing protein n=1 Tax=Dryococelus australis TaxID=614101 RepID=A0ABQ9GEV0_9NEOP|nr:hypothetical protein PR048_028617 [Dryococelus australis]